MRFIHSFSTRPISINCYDTNSIKRLLGNIIYYTASVLYLKRLNQTIVLHTDTLGKTLLGHLPYDEIHLTCDDIPKDIHPRFWAASKMYALAEEPINSIHIDGDVFIKSDKCLEAINDSDWDIIVQNFEAASWYKKEYSIFERNEDYCKSHDLILNSQGAFNTGILGFRNQELKDKFINGYKALVSYFSQVSKFQLDNGNYNTPDLIVEQKYIYQLSKDSKVNILLDNNDAKEIGYQHILSMQKFSLLDKCMEIIKMLDINYYNKTYKLCQTILNI